MLRKTSLWMAAATIAGFALLAVPANVEAQQGRGRAWQRQSDYRQERGRYAQLDCCRCACPRYANAGRGLRDGRGLGAWQRDGRGFGRGPALGNRGLRDGRGPGAWQRGNRGRGMDAQPLPRGRRGPAFDDGQRDGRGWGNRWRDETDEAPRGPRRN